MNTKTRGALLSIAVALLLATVVTWSGLSARAMPDMRNSPAFDTLNEVPVWTSRYLRSTASMTTTDEGNGEERIALLDIPVKLVEWLRKKMGMDKGEVKVPEEISKNKKSAFDAFKKWWASAINSLFHKDDEVKSLVESLVENKNGLKSVVDTLDKKHFQRWFNMERSAEDIHDLLGLPTGPELLESPLVWIWLDYTIWIGQVSNNFVGTIEVFQKMFKDDAVIAKMFEDVGAKKFGTKIFVVILKRSFLRYWLKLDRESTQLASDLDRLKFTKEQVKRYMNIYNHYHSAPEATDVLGT